MASGVTTQMVDTVLNKSWFSAKKIPFLKSFEKLKKLFFLKKNFFLPLRVGSGALA
jgi:hypothetical protein